MISLTLVTAVGVKLTGNLGVVSTFGVVVVAICRISLKLTQSLLYTGSLLILIGFFHLDEAVGFRVATIFQMIAFRLTRVYLRRLPPIQQLSKILDFVA
jgi:hypothetical protein